MKKSIEGKIRLNVVLIYAIVAAVCVVVVLYVYNLRGGMDEQKEGFRRYNVELTLTNDLIAAVQRAQVATNLYISSQDLYHLDSFYEQTDSIASLVDSLVLLSGDPFRSGILLEVRSLLERNYVLVLELKKQFDRQSPFDSIAEKLQHYHLAISGDSLLATAIRKDTIISATPRKNFWKRLGALFSSGKKDSLMSVVMSQVDTLMIPPVDASELFSELKGFSEEAGQMYADQLDEIKQGLGELMVSEYEISRQISDLLVRLHRETLDSVLDEIRKGERFIEKNYSFSWVAALVLLLLILFFIVLIIRNLNKGVAVRRALEEANALNSSLLEERHRFLLAVAHDIKAPLSSILGYLELARSEYTAPDELKALQSMRDSGQYILSLLEKLLEFSSLEQGNVQVHPDCFDVWDLCEGLAEMFAPLAAQKNLAFDFYTEKSQRLCVYADAVKIRQIFINILSNAVKYTTSGGIRLGFEYDGEQLHFLVCDSGVGIPDEDMDSLFKPFMRIEKNSRLAQGSGLGMYVVKGLVELLHGEIKVQSEVGKGTQIEVILPASEVSVSVSERKEKGAPVAGNENSYRVLAIDDDDALLTVLGKMLERLGHEFFVCSDFSALENALDNRSVYDMVLTDMEMGAFSGWDVLHRVRETDHVIPVVVMTARADLDEDWAAASGFSGILCKPFSLETLSALFGNMSEDGSLVVLAEVEAEFDLTLLQDMCSGDWESVRKILQVFVDSTSESLCELQKAVEVADFDGAQALCHKMLGMFSQLRVSNTLTDFLQKMDSLRGRGVEVYPDWQADATVFVRTATLLVQRIAGQYVH